MTTARTEAITILRPDAVAAGTRAIAIEVPVAIEIDGLGYAVMMMTPADLPAFTTGFLLTERLADSADDVRDIDVFEAEAGWIVRVGLSERCRGGSTTASATGPATPAAGCAASPGSNSCASRWRAPPPRRARHRDLRRAGGAACAPAAQCRDGGDPCRRRLRPVEGRAGRL
ncbi:formate dehydrogenase accessory sulfurtransferase FdhD [Sphingomonas aerolata]|uniref:formate dehydrogenase accessory sulfurtransferase FdhD n=1 Tax=Sphingomonas aerolata TaxID=185951 RepID=UPI002FE0426E